MKHRKGIRTFNSCSVHFSDVSFVSFHFPVAVGHTMRGWHFRCTFFSSCLNNEEDFTCLPSSLHLSYAGCFLHTPFILNFSLIFRKLFSWLIISSCNAKRIKYEAIKQELKDVVTFRTVWNTALLKPHHCYIVNNHLSHAVFGQYSGRYFIYTGCFTTLGHNFRR
jgi:hypothetical protein